MSPYHIPLCPNETYHLFNRAVGSEKLFYTADNYRYFLDKMKQHILPIADFFTYSLIPNHFHLLVRIKDGKIIAQHFEQKKKKIFNATSSCLSDFIMEQFSNWLNGYTKAFNKMYNRKGALFMDYIKRSIVSEDSDFTSYIFYIHKNATHHNLCDKIGIWAHDGYQSLLSDKPTLLLRDETIAWFGSRERFIEFHDQPVPSKKVELFE